MLHKEKDGEMKKRGSIHINKYYVYTSVCYMKGCWNYVIDVPRNILEEKFVCVG